MLHVACYYSHAPPLPRLTADSILTCFSLLSESLSKCSCKQSNVCCDDCTLVSISSICSLPRVLTHHVRHKTLVFQPLESLYLDLLAQPNVIVIAVGSATPIVNLHVMKLRLSLFVLSLLGLTVCHLCRTLSNAVGRCREVSSRRPNPDGRQKPRAIPDSPHSSQRNLQGQDHCRIL